MQQPKLGWIVCLLFSGIALGSGNSTGNYFQQEVAYTIQVELNDSTHSLSAQETILYINNSPDTLDFIWFHLWPNAYRNNETAYARQKFESRSTRFYYSEDKDRGYIDSLDFRTDGESLRWTFHPDWIDVAKVELNQPLLPGDSVIIETPFYVKIPKVFSRLGHTGKHYEITQWYPKPAVYDQYGWHPMPYLDRGEFYSEFGTFDVFITLPGEYRVMATGDLVDGEAEYRWLDSLAQEGDSLHALDKKAFKKRIKILKKTSNIIKDSQDDSPDTARKMKTLHFHQDQVHDFAWFADPDWIIRKGELWLADSTRKVTLWSMYLPKNAKLWESSLDYIHDAGYWYSQFFGPYPYNHISAVDGDLSAGGGMEYPNITVISSNLGNSKDALEMVIMHEVGHNWVYGILGSNERDHAWMDEGLNEWANIRYWEKKYPERNRAFYFVEPLQTKAGIGRHLQLDWVMNYMSYAELAFAGDDQPIEMTSAAFTPSNYGSIIYGKTGIWFRYLQYYLGDEMTDSIFHDYYDTWKFKHPYPHDLEAIYTRHVDEDLTWFWEGVMRSTRIVDYAVQTVNDNSVTLVNYGTLDVPLEIAVYDHDGREIHREWIIGFTGEKTLDIPAEAYQIKLDPANRMPDINKSNNTYRRKIGLHFVFDQPDYSKREWYWLPWFFDWNAHNGWTPGLRFYSGYIPTYSYGSHIGFGWDFNHHRVIGNIGGMKKMQGQWGFHSMEISGDLGQGSGRCGAQIEWEGTWKKPAISYPVSGMEFALYYHDLDSLALSPSLYSAGQYTILKGGWYYRDNSRAMVKYGLKGTLQTGLSGGSFTQIGLTGTIQKRWTKSMRINLRMFAGHLLGDTVPRQYRWYVGGGIDPNFEQTFVFDRTADPSRYNIHAEQYIQDGPALRGRAIDDKSDVIVATETVWAINLDQSLPKIPFKLFVDFAGGSDLTESLVDAGLKLDFQRIQLILPLYQSWDSDTTPTDKDWILDRLRFSISFSGFRIGF